MGLRHHRSDGFAAKFMGGLSSTAKALGTVHTIYKLGHAAYQVGSTLAPLAAALI